MRIGYKWFHRKNFRSVKTGIIRQVEIMGGETRIGIVGSGFIARGLVMALEGQTDMKLSRVLTRSNINKRADFSQKDILTNTLEDFIDNSDIVVECSGDVIYATDVIDEVLMAHIPVVTMDSELQVTTGSYFSNRGYFTEAEGDQPGCIAALREEILQMGFKPLVYGNIKGYLNHLPTPEDMQFWAHKQGISLDKTVAFTDGTKVQIEQAFVANGLGAGIIKPGLVGLSSEDVVSGATALAKLVSNGHPISDYILSPGSPAGIFIAAEHDEKFRDYLRYYKMGDGPFYTLIRNYHLCNLEIIKTLRRVMRGMEILLNNGDNPFISVAAIAKRLLSPGEMIKRGIGSFDVRGIAVRIPENPDHVPIGLLSDAVIRRTIKPGQQINFNDVEIPPSLALDAWLECAKT
jgi:predicted homoserine dehydrogenase-like protein